ncbi:hypothetical protein Lal_00041710 [Lupinus albus]|nr:hypothetical protein Lal_00041710 [Lupinus albus]
MVGMWKDPKVGGGVGGTCEVTRNQTQHSPRMNKIRKKISMVEFGSLHNDCSKHMTVDKGKFSFLTPMDKGYVTYGDNNKGKILGEFYTWRESKSSIKKIQNTQSGRTNIPKKMQLAISHIEHNNKEDFRDIKANKVYIIWDAPEEGTTSTSISEDEESNKLCLMAQNMNSYQVSEQDESSDVNSSDSSSNSDDSLTYDIIYGTYVEMHEELKKLAKTYADRKMLILEHEKKICELQTIIDELKLENETLDLIYANSSCHYSTK